MTSTLSIVYDKQQDRLNLLFTTDEQKQRVGVMTRRLLKNTLKNVPVWLASKETDSVTQKKTTQAQQHVVNQFQHQVARQKPVEKVDVRLNKTITHFMIETVSLSSAKQHDSSHMIEIHFISKVQENKISLSLTTEQLHTILGAMMDKVASWDLLNPWLEKGVPAINAVISNSEIMH